MPLPPPTLAELRETLRAIEGGGERVRPVLPFGLAALDERLADGGIRLDALHEVAGEGSGWGDDAAGQCDVPPALPPVRSLAAGARHTVVALENGTVIAWGDGGSGQCTPPQHISRTQQVSAGRAHTMALACTEPRVELATGSLGPIGAGVTRLRQFHALPLSVGHASVQVRARADLGTPERFVSVKLNGKSRSLSRRRS